MSDKQEDKNTVVLRDETDGILVLPHEGRAIPVIITNETCGGLRVVASEDERGSQLVIEYAEEDQLPAREPTPAEKAHLEDLRAQHEKLRGITVESISIAQRELLEGSCPAELFSELAQPREFALVRIAAQAGEGIVFRFKGIPEGKQLVVMLKGPFGSEFGTYIGRADKNGDFQIVVRGRWMGVPMLRLEDKGTPEDPRDMMC